jgi:hypothetical protein
VIRPHAREIDQTGKSFFVGLPKSVQSRIHFSNEHARIIASGALAAVSFGGTVACDAVIAGCPVIEVLSPQPISRSDQLAASVERFGLAVRADSHNLKHILTETMKKRSEVAASQTRNLHALYKTIHDPTLHRETIVREISRLQPQKPKDWPVFT